MRKFCRRCLVVDNSLRDLRAEIQQEIESSVIQRERLHVASSFIGIFDSAVSLRRSFRKNLDDLIERLNQERKP